MSAAAIVEANLESLPEKDQQFARSLLAAAKSSRGCSMKQAAWIKTLADRLTAPPQPVVTLDASAIVDLFRTASSNLRWPKIMLQSDDKTLQFSIAGAKSKVPGAINVTDGGKFGNNVFYGRILPDGTWDGRDQSVLPIVQAFAADPATAATKHGKRFGYCCFCSRELNEKKSLEMGYGPVCAEKWGLPH